MFKNAKLRVSKKASVAIGTAVIIIFNDSLGLNLSTEQMGAVVVTAIGYIFGQAKVDQSLISKGLKHK